MNQPMKQQQTKQRQTVLYIDGQNFLARLRGILRRKGVDEIDLTKFDFWGFLNRVFKDQHVDLAQIYFAKLHAFKDTPEKSKELIEREAEIRSLLESQGFHYIVAGSVRPRRRGDEVEFVEKGVDIRIAVDLVKDVIDGTVGTVLLMSSDSDMQPAVYEAKSRGAKVWYIGFRSRMNKGLMLTTDRYVLISNDDVAAFYKGQPTPSKAKDVKKDRVGESTQGQQRAATQLAQPPRTAQDAPTPSTLSVQNDDFNLPPWSRK